MTWQRFGLEDKKEDEIIRCRGRSAAQNFDREKECLSQIEDYSVDFSKECCTHDCADLLTLFSFLCSPKWHWTAPSGCAELVAQVCWVRHRQLRCFQRDSHHSASGQQARLQSSPSHLCPLRYLAFVRTTLLINYLIIKLRLNCLEKKQFAAFTGSARD